MSATVVAVSDSKGGILSNDGLRYSDVSAHKRKTGSVRDFPGCDNISNRELLELDVDVLVPAALENQITRENAGRIGARLVAEAANGPTTPEADDVLRGIGVEVIPDVLANAGGVTMSYLEWVQNLQNYYWTASEVDTRLRDVMAAAFRRVWRSKQENEVDMRMGAYIYAIKRVSEAIKVRGWV
ncbi:MAG: Glu/Leu/Phe/Val dehydrogenase, partial [Candidatus Geothermarchaeales archaeon]